MVDNQEIFFEGLDFEKVRFKYGFGELDSYKVSDGRYYRIDALGDSYVIEFAENEEQAKYNAFDDADWFDGDTLEVIINNIKSALREYVLQ